MTRTTCAAGHARRGPSPGVRCTAQRCCNLLPNQAQSKQVPRTHPAGRVTWPACTSRLRPSTARLTQPSVVAKSLHRRLTATAAPPLPSVGGGSSVCRRCLAHAALGGSRGPRRGLRAAPVGGLEGEVRRKALPVLARHHLQDSRGLSASHGGVLVHHVGAQLC